MSIKPGSISIRINTAHEDINLGAASAFVSKGAARNKRFTSSIKRGGNVVAVRNLNPGLSSIEEKCCLLATHRLANPVF
jgi:hypothetical protein